MLFITQWSYKTNVVSVLTSRILTKFSREKAVVSHMQATALRAPISIFSSEKSQI